MPALTDAQKMELVAYVNDYRAKNQAPALTWDAAIYSVSQAWADRLLSAHLMQHSGNPAYGENLAYFKGYGTDLMQLIKKAIDAWYSEIALYDFSKPGFSDTTGHFTCLVWVSSKKFAMGISLDSATNEAYVVMNTSPPGNYVGEFAQNVLPLVGSGQTKPTGTGTAVSLPGDLQTHKREIFQLLYNIVYAINTKQSKTLIISIVNTIIAKINSYPNF
jgi:uncharacterized protein YkwD